MQEGHVRDFHPSYVDTIGQGLTELFERTAALGNENGDTPVPDSIAAHEGANAARPASIATAYATATLLIEYSAEHLSAFAKLISEPIE